jgi:hypothetical protein
MVRQSGERRKRLRPAAGASEEIRRRSGEIADLVAVLRPRLNGREQ